MLVKYIGANRTSFLEDGLFRITQPKFLNDPKGECIFSPFFNTFSEADLKYAYRKYTTSIFYEGPNVSDEFLIKHYLLPTGQRYNIDDEPSLLGFSEFDGFNTMEEYDRFHASKYVEQINSCLLEELNKTIGILSLTNSLTNQEMWLKYGQHGQGIAIAFDSTHDFFVKNNIKKVIYDNHKRASITFYENIIRINGIPIPNEYENADEVTKYYFKNLDPDDLFTRLFLTKNNRWKDEIELRIIFDLIDSDKDVINGNDLIALKYIPFESFTELVLGWAISQELTNEILGKIKKIPF